MPGRASRIASMIPKPVIRVASRRIAISRGLLNARSASRGIGSRSRIVQIPAAGAAFQFSDETPLRANRARPRDLLSSLWRAPPDRLTKLRAQHLRPMRCINGASLEGRDHSAEFVAREHRFDACSGCRFLARIQAGPEHLRLPAFVTEIQEQRGMPGLPVDHQQRARLHYARDIEELASMLWRSGCSPGRSVVPCRMATPSPIFSITRARRAAYSCGGNIASVYTGCAPAYGQQQQPGQRSRINARDYFLITVNVICDGYCDE